MMSSSTFLSVSVTRSQLVSLVRMDISPCTASYATCHYSKIGAISFGYTIHIWRRLLLLTGSNFINFAILFTFRVLILAILDFNHKTH